MCKLKLQRATSKTISSIINYVCTNVICNTYSRSLESICYICPKYTIQLTKNYLHSYLSYSKNWKFWLFHLSNSNFFSDLVSMEYGYTIWASWKWLTFCLLLGIISAVCLGNDSITTLLSKSLYQQTDIFVGMLSTWKLLLQ